MYQRRAAAILVVCAALLTGPAVARAAVRYPVKVAPNGRTLVDQDGQPFLLWGDAAWSLIAQPMLADAERYLDDRAARGVNLVMVNLIEHKFASRAPADAKGNLPFTGRPFASPNSAYFADAEEVIAAAAARGITVLLAPLYLGYQCGDEGWCAAVQAATTDEMRSWGRYVGQRYGAYDNVVWLIGGDTDPGVVADKVSEMVAGIRDFDTRHLMTAHNDEETYALTRWPNATWLNLNAFYTYSSSLYTMALGAYQRTPILPFFLIESAYENEHGSTPQSLRAAAYWTMLSGAAGQIFGNCPIWSFGSTTSPCGQSNWTGQLGSPGSVGMGIAQKLFASRAWQLLVPDTSHSAVTGGFGASGSTTYVTAARASDGSTMIAYLPAATTITVSLTSVSGPEAVAWWYDPSSGTVTKVGSFGAVGTRSFTPPPGGADWVFVLDSGARSYGAPGASPVPVPAGGLWSVAFLTAIVAALGARRAARMAGRM